MPEPTKYRNCSICGWPRNVAIFDGDSTRCGKCVMTQTDQSDLIDLNARGGHQRRRTAERQGSRNRRYRSTYGITVAQYDEMLGAQGGVCALCLVVELGYYQPLNVDHDHATGEVRGLLCTPCNMALGFLRDNVDVVRRDVGAGVDGGARLICSKSAPPPPGGTDPPLGT